MKRISKFKESLILILAGMTVFLCCYKNSQQAKEFNKLEKTNKELHKELKITLEEVSLLYAEVERLSDENGIFTSMLGEIEGEPGGSEILKKLWEEHSLPYEETE